MTRVFSGAGEVLPAPGGGCGAELAIGGIMVPRGTARRLLLPVCGPAAPWPPLELIVIRGVVPGPRLLLTAGLHGDELNGVAIVREVGARLDPRRLAGDVVCLPVVNVPGFLARSRYLPDGSDLNRSFPGSPGGALAARLAHGVLREIVGRCDCGIDFHTAARGRSNVAHVRGDMDRPDVRTLARAFGTPIVVHNHGHPRSLRRSATETGVPTIALEAGGTGRLQGWARRCGVAGVQNVLRELGMLQGRRRRPPFRVIVRGSVWVRARRGGRSALAVRPGDLVYEGWKIGTITDARGRARRPILSPVTGLVLGAALEPAFELGYPLCHIARLRKTLRMVERHLQGRA